MHGMETVVLGCAGGDSGDPLCPDPPKTGGQLGLRWRFGWGLSPSDRGLFREVCSRERDERCQHVRARPCLPPAPPAGSCAGRPEEVTTACSRAALPQPRGPALLFLPSTGPTRAAPPVGRPPAPEMGGYGGF